MLAAAEQERWDAAQAITVPLSPTATPQGRRMTSYERPTVLVVDDDRATREMFDYALRFAGFRVLLAADGFVALRLIEHELPDVIVLDLDLPHVSGIDVQQEVMAHAETSAIPIVIVTGTEWTTPKGVFQI